MTARRSLRGGADIVDRRGLRCQRHSGWLAVPAASNNAMRPPHRKRLSSRLQPQGIASPALANTLITNANGIQVGPTASCSTSNPCCGRRRQVIQNLHQGSEPRAQRPAHRRPGPHPAARPDRRARPCDRPLTGADMCLACCWIQLDLTTAAIDCRGAAAAARPYAAANPEVPWNPAEVGTRSCGPTSAFDSRRRPRCRVSPTARSSSCASTAMRRANTAALKAAGVTAASVAPQGRRSRERDSSGAPPACSSTMRSTWAPPKLPIEHRHCSTAHSRRQRRKSAELRRNGGQRHGTSRLAGPQCVGAVQTKPCVFGSSRLRRWLEASRTDKPRMALR